MPKKGKRVTTSEMEAIRIHGKTIYTTPFFSIRMMKKTTPTTVGVVVSKKVEKTAVGRNRIKRRIREILKEISLPQHTAVVVYAKKEIKKLNFIELQKSIKNNTHTIE